MNQADVARLSSFIDSHKGDFPDPKEAAVRAVPRAISDLIFEIAFASGLRIRRLRAGREKHG
jgi:hypothetical protein